MSGESPSEADELKHHRSSIIQKTRDSTAEELIEALREEVARLRNANTSFYASIYANCLTYCDDDVHIPLQGMTARHVKERIVQLNQLDNKPRLNTSSYVNVVMEPEEEEVALLGLGVNLADGSVYPASVRIHDIVVGMIAKLWNAPKPPKSEYVDGKVKYCGAGTVGSTEACLLAGLALKFRWREWYAKKHGINKKDVMGIIPNIVISTCYQAAWEKFFRYMDVEPRFVKPSVANALRVSASEMVKLCDEKTLGVVGILGNHYNGSYDPIWEINDEIEKVNTANGWQIGIHVDAASGGFIAPFQDDTPVWDFRLKNVLSISTSGHKFGESSCGTGWVVFRHRHDLAEHIAISVTYLGGKSDSYTLNFSRPATAAYVQYYKLLRLGWEGYRSKVKNQMANTKYLRDRMRRMKTPENEPWFEIVDAGDTHCLPVLAARLNPKLKLNFDDIDLQHALAESHWYVSGYCLSFPNPNNDEQIESLVTDSSPESTMFRVVVKSNLDAALAEHLAEQFEDVVPVLSRMENGINNIRGQKEMEQMQKILKVTDGDCDEMEQSFRDAMNITDATETTRTDVASKKGILRQSLRLKILALNKITKKPKMRNTFTAC